jgi:hypothetical protein
MDYKAKYLKYKQKYLIIKQKGGNLKTIFFDNYPYQKELDGDKTIKIKFMDNEYNVFFDDNKIIIHFGNKKILEIEKFGIDYFVLQFDNCLDLLKLIMKILNIEYCKFFSKYFDDENLFLFDDNYFLLNTEHSQYLEIKKQFLQKIEKFFNLLTLEKIKKDNRYYIFYKTIEYEILFDNVDYIIKNDDKILLKFELYSCVSFMIIKEYDDCKNLIDLILYNNNIPIAICSKKICDECIVFNDVFIYLNKCNELYKTLKCVMIEETYNTKLGISIDLLREKLYSINFLWLRTDSFTEGCYSINGKSDVFEDLSSIKKILELQKNPFFIQIINFSKNNPNALVNFWIDATQVKIETIINLRVIFDIFNRNLETNICIRDIWSLNLINEMNSKYPNILPKCTGFSLIMRVDLYKCFICVEELDRHMYSVFADLDTKPINQDEILSENNIRILNRIGLVMSKFSQIFENGFQILGSKIEKIRKAVIESFTIMMIERFMIIFTKILDLEVKNRYFSSEYQNEIIYRSYKLLYNVLYYKCGYGFIYTNEGRLMIKNPDDLLTYYTDILSTGTEYNEINMIYIPYEIFNDDIDFNVFGEKITFSDLIELIKKYVDMEKMILYINKLRFYNRGWAQYEKIISKYSSDISKLFEIFFDGIPQVQEDDLILFTDKDTIPPTSGIWPFRMCKKYSKLF